MAYLVRKPLSPSVVKQRLSAVGRWFLFATGRDCRLSLITGRLLPYLGTALEGMSRTYSIQKRLRFPLTTDKLDILLRCLWHMVKNLCRLDKQMWSALLLTGVYGLCRCGEITTKTQKAFSPATDHLRSDITTYGTAADHYNKRPKFGSFGDRGTRVTVEVELLVLFLEKINKSGTKMVFCDLVN